MTSFSFLADENRLGRCRRVASYQVALCVESVHAVDESDGVHYTSRLILIQLEEAVFEM